MDYVTYIGSAAWRRNPARLKALSDAGGRCRLCPAHAPLEVHHSTYERLGCEQDGDLIALCGDCHRGVTSFLRERRYATVAPKRANIERLHDARILLNDPTAGGY
jgi:hypothetical protein